MTRLWQHQRPQAMIIVIRRRGGARVRRSGTRHVRHVTLPAPHAFRMGGANLDARAGPGMAGEAFAAHLQWMGDSWRRSNGGPASLPGALWQSREARGHEQRGRRGRHVTLPAAPQRAARRAVAVRRGGGYAHAGDRGAVRVVTGDARANRGVVRNRRRRAVVGASGRACAGRPRHRFGRHRRTARDRQGRQTGARGQGRGYTRSRRTAHFL